MECSDILLFNIYYLQCVPPWRFTVRPTSNCASLLTYFLKAGFAVNNSLNQLIAYILIFWFTRFLLFIFIGFALHLPLNGFEAMRSLKKGQGSAYRIQEGITGEVRLVERCFYPGKSALAEAMEMLDQALKTQQAA